MVEFLKNLVIPRYQNNYYPRLLRKRVLAVVTLVIIGVNILASSVGGSVFAGAVNSSELVVLTNQERTAVGMPGLGVDARLVSAAHAKAQNIFDLQYWSHYGPNGESPWQFVIASGYDYVYAGENLAKGFSSSEAAHSAWMASQTHRENILSSNYQHIGIAVVPGVLQGEDVILVVQMFGSLSSTPVSSIPVQESSQTPGAGIPSPVSQPAVEPEGVSEIKIEYPDDGSMIAESDFFMNGTASAGLDSIVITDNGEESPSEISEEGAWDFRPEGGWDEGEHEVRVAGSDNVVSDTVVFGVDTTPPSVSSDNLRITRDESSPGVFEVYLETDGTAVEVVLVAGSFSTMLVENDGEDGANGFSAFVTRDDISKGDKVMLYVSDELGNIAEVDVSENVLGVIAVEEKTSGESGGWFTGDISLYITRGAVLLIAILFAIDIVYLFRLKIIHTRGKTLFPMALWVIVIGVAMVLGTGGTIL